GGDQRHESQRQRGRAQAVEPGAVSANGGGRTGDRGGGGDGRGQAAEADVGIDGLGVAVRQRRGAAETLREVRHVERPSARTWRWVRADVMEMSLIPKMQNRQV